MYLYMRVSVHVLEGRKALVRQGKTHYLVLIPESELRVK